MKSNTQTVTDKIAAARAIAIEADRVAAEATKANDNAQVAAREARAEAARAEAAWNAAWAARAKASKAAADAWLDVTKASV